jgi:hypothetical protein
LPCTAIGLAALGCDLRDNLVGALLAGCVIDGDGSASGGELDGDFGADAL